MNSLDPESITRNEELDRQREAFLASGKRIQQIPLGTSGLDDKGRAKQILSRRQKASANAAAARGARG